MRRSRSRRVICRGLRHFHVEQHVGTLVLNGLKRSDRSTKLDSFDGVLDGCVYQALCSSDHFVGERDGSQIERVFELGGLITISTETARGDVDKFKFR